MPDGLPFEGGFTRRRRVYPPKEGLPAEGGLIRRRWASKRVICVHRWSDLRDGVMGIT
ncbi:MAG: hypothetical protein FD166_3604 [Bacteroidetes bacterium]|nr:MAG: hypothetical protein FD166_3604 [Bacteroidota bacterium]